MRIRLFFIIFMLAALAAGCSPTDGGGPAENILCYEKPAGGSAEIFSNNMDGSNPKNVSNHPAADAYPSWSPDGSYIAFYRAGAVIVYDVKTKTQTEVTADGGSAEEQIQWAANGRLCIAYSRPLGNPKAAYLMDPDGGNKRKIFDYSPSATHCTIYPCLDSRTFFYVDARKVYKTTIDGAAQTLAFDLDRGKGRYYTVCDFNPLSRELIVSTEAEIDTPGTIASVNTDTKEVKTLLVGGKDVFFSSPRFSKNYAMIVYREQCADGEYLSVFDGGVSKRFVHYPPTDPPETFSPVPMEFSPDGRHIAFSKRVFSSGGSWKDYLYTVDVETAELHFIDEGARASWNPRP